MARLALLCFRDEAVHLDNQVRAAGISQLEITERRGVRDRADPAGGLGSMR